MFTILLHFFCDVIKFLLSILSHFISIIQSRPLQPLPTADSLPNQLICLRAQRSALIAQRDLIQHQIADLDASINVIIQLSDSNQTSNALISPQLSRPHLSSPSSTPTHQTQHHTPTTPQRRRTRSTTHPTSTGKPYPIPYLPPRTPEEERRNNIISWVNELRARNHNK
jgi:hypothetical protein